MWGICGLLQGDKSAMSVPWACSSRTDQGYPTTSSQYCTIQVLQAEKPSYWCVTHLILFYTIVIIFLIRVVVRLSAAPVRGRHSGSSVMIRILIWHRFYTGCPSWRNPGRLLQHRDKNWVSPWFRAALHPLIARPSAEQSSHPQAILQSKPPSRRITGARHYAWCIYICVCVCARPVTGWLELVWLLMTVHTVYNLKT